MTKQHQMAYLRRRWLHLLECIDQQMNNVRLVGQTNDTPTAEANYLLEKAAVGLAERLAVVTEPQPFGRKKR